jgi:uncharacterized membrane protein YkvA (DUF1232 family)
VDTVAQLVIGVLGAWLILIVLLWILKPPSVHLREVVALVPDVLRLVRDLVRDSSTPREARLALVILLAWIVSPIDLIPEFVPVLGPLDDVVVAAIVLRYVGRKVGMDELQRRWLGSMEGFELLRRVIG